MSATFSVTAAALIVALAAMITTAQAQGLTPYYGPDGRVYYRRATDPAVYAPQPAIPHQPYAAPQTAPAPTTTPPAPREQRVKAKPKPKPKPKPDTSKLPVAAAPEPTVAVPVTKTDLPPPPTPSEVKDDSTLADWCKEVANAKAPLCRNVGSSKVQR